MNLGLAQDVPIPPNSQALLSYLHLDLSRPHHGPVIRVPPLSRRAHPHTFLGIVHRRASGGGRAYHSLPLRNAGLATSLQRAPFSVRASRITEELSGLPPIEPCCVYLPPIAGSALSSSYRSLPIYPNSSKSFII